MTRTVSSAPGLIRHLLVTRRVEKARSARHDVDSSLSVRPVDEVTEGGDIPMRYMMFVCVDPAAETYVPEEDNIDAWVAETDRRQVRVLGHRLKGPANARTVRRRNGKVLVTDGPFAETKEWIAGFDILECVTLDEAVDIAARHPMARFGRLEIRPFWPEE